MLTTTQATIRLHGCPDRYAAEAGRLYAIFAELRIDVGAAGQYASLPADVGCITLEAMLDAGVWRACSPVVQFAPGAHAAHAAHAAPVDGPAGTKAAEAAPAPAQPPAPARLGLAPSRPAAPQQGKPSPFARAAANKPLGAPPAPAQVHAVPGGLGVAARSRAAQASASPAAAPGKARPAFDPNDACDMDIPY